MANKKLRILLNRVITACLTATLLLTPLQALAEEETPAAESGEAAAGDAAETSAEAAMAQGAVADVTLSAQDRKEALEEAIVSEDVTTIKGHELVVENDTLALYLYEPTLSLIVRDKKTGAIMESTVQESDGTLNTSWENFIKSGIGFDILNDVNEERSDLLSAQAEIGRAHV